MEERMKQTKNREADERKKRGEYERAEFWKKYKKELSQGYFMEGTDYMKPELIVEYPEKMAHLLKDYKKNKLSQIWKFYAHARHVQYLLWRKNYQLLAMRAELCELQPIVHNAKEKGVVTDDFKKFININIKCIKEKEDLDAFIKHFQSVIAYLPRENQKP